MLTATRLLVVGPDGVYKPISQAPSVLTISQQHTAFSDVASAWLAIAFLRSEGSVNIWPHSFPKPVGVDAASTPATTAVVAIAAQGDTLVLAQDDAVSLHNVLTGAPLHSLRVPERVASVSCGLQRVLVRGRESGRVFSADFRDTQLAPLPQFGVGSPCGPAVQLSCGWHHAGIVTAHHQLYMLGHNSHGQCAVESLMTVAQPTRVTAWDGCVADPAQGSIRAVSCGGWHSAALSTLGDVYTWGSGSHGQLGYGPSSGGSSVDRRLAVEPEPPTVCSSAAAINLDHLGGFYTGFAERQPRLVAAAWSNTADTAAAAAAVAETDETRVVEIACGGKHTSVLTSDGSVYVWGQACFPAKILPTKSSAFFEDASVPSSASALIENVWSWGLEEFTVLPKRVPIEEIIAAASAMGTSGGISCLPAPVTPVFIRAGRAHTFVAMP